MKWQFLPLGLIIVAAVALVWRSSGKKAGSCDCKGNCAHGPEPEGKKPDALR